MHLSPRVNKQSFAPFELVHYDVWGLFPVMSPTGFKYFVIFIDDFSCVTLVPFVLKFKFILSFFLILVPFIMKFKLNFMSLSKH